MKKPNIYQIEAIEHKDGPALVTACPGSGKTFVLVERVVSLIKEHNIKQKNILCLTFTNKAANEMKERICKRLGIKKPDFFIGTFHSLCALLIRKLGPGRGYSSKFTILDDRDQLELTLQVARYLEYNIEKGEARKIVNMINYYRDQMEDFQWVRDNLRTDYLEKIAENYIDRCKNNNMVDFSGLIYEAIQIIDNHEEIKRKIQNTFKYILVDEVQDTNVSQFYLVNLLAGKHKNIMLIGDIDQSIYKFRGARYQNINDFIEMHSDCRVITLSKNYRSTPQIIEKADRLIKHSISHVDIKFETDNKDGEPVRVRDFFDQYKEAEWISKMAKKLIDGGGWEPSDMAVLYRINKMSEPIEQALTTQKIPYEVIGSWNFYDRREARDCIAMLKLVQNGKDGIAFHRVCSLVKGMGNITVGKIEKKSAEKNISLIESCREFAKETNVKNIKIGCEHITSVFSTPLDHRYPSQCLKKLVNHFKYDDFLDRVYKGDAKERKENVEQIMGTANEFRGEEGLSKYLQQVSLVTSKEDKKEESKMVLMSLHAAKGLEFKIVFIIGVEDGILPHQQTVAEDPVEGISEEIRLLFVGITRAEKLLYLSWCRNRKTFGKYGRMSNRSSLPSQFLYKAGLLKK